MINDATGRPSTTSLVADALAQLTRLVETELRLLRTEIGEKIGEAVRAVIMLVVSAVLLVAALIFILQGVVDLLVYFGLQPFAAAFAVGAVIAVIAGCVVAVALRSLSAKHMAPNRSVTQIMKDAHAIKDQVT